MSQSRLKDSVDSKLLNLLTTDADSQLLETAKEAVASVFRDKTTQMQALLLSISEQKISAMGKLVNFADRLVTKITADEDVETELDEYELSERIKMLSEVVRQITLLATSTEITKELADSLQTMERSLAVGNTKRIDPEVRANLQWLTTLMESELAARRRQQRNAAVVSDIGWRDVGE